MKCMEPVLASPPLTKPNTKNGVSQITVEPHWHEDPVKGKTKQKPRKFQYKICSLWKKI